jgi:transposase InsO family protein
VADDKITSMMRHLRETPVVGVDGKPRLPRERFYGRRKMTRLLARRGVTAGEEKIGRLMRVAGMTGLVRGRRIVTTRANKPTASDLLHRVFDTDAPNTVWVADLTYVRTTSGWVYVSFITDAFARKIVACHASCSMTGDLVRDTLTLALAGRVRDHHPVTVGLIHHSDHGSQYTSLRFGEQLVHNDITPSMGTVGDSYDNALAETVNGLYKTECVTPDGPFHTLADVMDATVDWVHWYNHDRLHEHLGYATPDEAETEYYSTHKPLGNQ